MNFEAVLFPALAEYKKTHVLPAREAFDSALPLAAGGAGLKKATREYVHALFDYRERLEHSPGGVRMGGDGAVAFGHYARGAQKEREWVASELNRIFSFTSEQPWTDDETT